MEKISTLAKRVLFSGLTSAFLFTSALSIKAENLDEYLTRCDSTLVSIKQARVEDSEKLRKEYIHSLEILIEKDKTLANLNGIEEIQGEIERVSKEKIPEKTESQYPPIVKVNSTYLNTYLSLLRKNSGYLRDFIQQQDSCLKVKQDNLTRQGRIEEAKKVKEERLKLTDSPEYLQAKQLLEKENFSAKKQPLTPETLEIKVKQELCNAEYSKGENNYHFIDLEGKGKSLDLIFEDYRLSKITRPRKVCLRFNVPDGRRTDTKEAIGVYCNEKLIGTKQGAQKGINEISLDKNYFSSNPFSRYNLVVRLQGGKDGLGISSKESGKLPTLILEYDK